MCRPFRRYCVALAERLGKSISEVMQLDSSEVSEWMAYDLTLDEKWCDEYQLEQQKKLATQSKINLFKQLIGGG